MSDDLPGLHVVGDASAKWDALARYQTVRDSAQGAAQRIVMGALVVEFTNEELHAIADFLTFGEVMTLRAIGLLGADEGFVGPGTR